MNPASRRLSTEAREELRNLLRQIIAVQFDFERYAVEHAVEPRLAGSVHNHLAGARWAMTMILDERREPREDADAKSCEVSS